MKKLLFAGLFAVIPSTHSKAETAPCECSRCIAVYGDTRTGNAVHKKIAGLIEAAHPRVVFHTGDLVPKGNDADGWADFKSITKSLRASASFYAVLGNHEAGGESVFTSLFSNPGNGRWYSEDVGGIRFIMLDYLSPLGKEDLQYKWLDGELKAPAGGNKFTVVIVHKPLLSTGYHGHEKWESAGDLGKLFRERGVALVIAGHDHDYERLEKDGLVQLVTGGGGGAGLRGQRYKSPYSKIFAKVNHYCLISVCGEVLKVEAFDLDNKLIDTFEIRSKQSAVPKARD